MPRFSEVSNARFINPADFTAGERKQAVIDKIFEEIFRNEPVPKMVMTLVTADGWQRDLTLNQTNGRALATAFGDEMNDWVGEMVEIFVVDTQYNGQPTKGVRVAALADPQPLLPGTPPPTDDEPPPTDDDLDDEIPFG